MTEKLKILIVDDRKENLVALRHVLSEVDAEIIETSSGNHALAMTLVHDFALAILDVVMPEMDGYELAELLRGDPKTTHLPVIFMTAAYGEEIHIFKGYESGAVDYIVKPYTPAVLLAKVRIFLDLHRAQKELAQRVLDLAASEERFRTLVATVPDIVYRIDAEGKFTFLNDAVWSLGYHPEDLIGQPFAEIVLPNDVEDVSRRFVLPRFAGNPTGDEDAPRLFDERRTGFRKTMALEVRLVSRKADAIVPAELFTSSQPLITAEVNSSGLYAISEGRHPVFLGTVGVIRDITQRKEVEVELSRYRQRLERMVEERTAELEKRVKEIECLYAVSSLVAESGTPIEEALKTAVDLITPGFQYPDIACARITFEDHVFATANFRQTSWNLSADIHIPGPAVEVCYLEGRPGLDEGPFLKEERQLCNEIARQLGVRVERQRAEKALRESEEKHRRLVENLSREYFFYVHDKDGIFTYVSPSVTEMLGYGQKEFEAHFSTYLTDNPVNKDVVGKTEESIKGIRRPPYLIEILHKAGGTRWLEVTEVPIFGADSQVEAVEGIAHDVTERKLAEEALRESEARYKRLVEGSPDIVWVFSDKRGMLYVSSRVEVLLGYPPEYLCQSPWLWNTSIHPEDRDYISQAILDFSAGKDMDVEYRIKDAFGNWRWFNDRSIGRRVMDDETIIEGISTDITERRLLEEQLRQSQKMEAIGTLAGGIAHDFNNILTTIIGNAQLALMDVDKEGPLREEIEEIRKAGERAAALTRQLLAFSRRQIVKTGILDLNEVITDLEKMLGRLIGEDMELLMIPGPDLWQVEADPGQIEQIIMNLTVNAKDAMPKGGKLTIETGNVDLDDNYFRKHGIKDEQRGTYVMLAVSDTGIGMDKVIQEHIFEPFFTTKEIGKGTGLGLSTVYGIVKQNKGFIWIYSEPGQGSAFKIYLPRAERDAASKKKEPLLATEIGGSETILIVEDDVSLRKLARIILEQKGYKVLEAENGEDALRVAEAHDGSIDLMITDVVMPKMGGKEVVKRLDPLYPHLKVIYMSGYTDNAIVNHGVLETGLNFIEKPFTPKALARKVRSILNSR